MDKSKQMIVVSQSMGLVCSQLIITICVQTELLLYRFTSGKLG